MTVVPLYCARFIKPSACTTSRKVRRLQQQSIADHEAERIALFQRGVVDDFNSWFQSMLGQYVFVVSVDSAASCTASGSWV